MTSYSIAEAETALPRLIDEALAGERVLIRRDGATAVELRPTSRDITSSRLGVGEMEGSLEWLRRRRRLRPAVNINSVALLRSIADETLW